jgi:hypothetical protein
MSAPQIPANSSLQFFREELVFSLGRTAADPAAADLSPQFKDLIDRWGPVNAQQLALWDAQTMADALVAAADDRLDALVDRLSPAVLALTGQKRSDPHYKLYFAVPPAELKRPVLGPELETIRGWLVHLAAETDPTLAALSKEFAAAVKLAGDAVKARRQADADNEQFRAKGALAVYLDDVRKTRDAIFATLEGRPAMAPTLPRDFASRFFRHRKPTANGDAKQARAEKRAAERAAAEAKAKAVAEAKAKVKDAQKALRALTK